MGGGRVHALHRAGQADKPLYDHAPWLNDPYDTVVSFAMLFVPFIAVCCLVRVLLCRRSEPLPTSRMVDLLRGCRVVLAAISFTLMTEWTALAVGANQTQWNGGTWLQVGLLVLLTVLTIRALVSLRHVRLPTFQLRAGADGQSRPDWLTDMVELATWQGRRLGPLCRPSLKMLNWVQGRPLGAVRRHTLWTAALLCSAFGLVVAVNQGVREKYDIPSTLILAVLLGCGMFGLLVGSGSYLGLIRSQNPLRGTRRRAVDAGVLTCVFVLVPFALRSHLWWIIGTRDAVAGVPQLAELLGVFAILIFAVVFATESLLRVHSEAAATLRRRRRSLDNARDRSD